MSEAWDVRVVDPLQDPGVADVVRAAFGTEDEYRLVMDLRADATTWIPELSLGAFVEDRLIGHVLFTDAEAGDVRAVLLAPLAVEPEWQGRGVGASLVRAGFDGARRMGMGLALVLGHPEYYPKFGFIPALPFGVEPPYPVEPKEAWMVMELASGALDSASGPLRMSAVFRDPALWRE